MYRQLAKKLSKGPDGLEDPTKFNKVFEYHPAELAGFLEKMWSRRLIGTESPQTFQGLPDIYNPFVDELPLWQHPNQPEKVVSLWHHLIYGYMIENTRIFEIFRKVLKEYAQGESLGVPSDEGQRWLRNTENLFYMDPPPFMIHTLTSEIRPQIRANRRNAYYRMFGLDLNHGTDNNEPFLYEKPAASNRDFVATFEELLREVWIGIANANNESGINPTDDASIANLAKRLYEMLHQRRQGGNLAREEFWCVATMSWFHHTIAFDSPIVKDLKAEGTSPAERLQIIGERVKLPASSKSENYIHLAENMSTILLKIEEGAFNDASQAPLLYKLYLKDTDTSEKNIISDHMKTIISHWSQATGRDMKANRFNPPPRQ